MRVGLSNQWEGPIILTSNEIQYTVLDTASRSAKRQRNMLDIKGDTTPLTPAGCAYTSSRAKSQRTCADTEVAKRRVTITSVD